MFGKSVMKSDGGDAQHPARLAGTSFYSAILSLPFHGDVRAEALALTMLMGFYVIGIVLIEAFILFWAGAFTAASEVRGSAISHVPGQVLSLAGLVVMIVLVAKAFTSLVGEYFGIISQYAYGQTWRAKARASGREIGAFLACTVFTFAPPVLWFQLVRSDVSLESGGTFELPLFCKLWPALYGPVAFAVAAVYQTVNPATVFAVIARRFVEYLFVTAYATGVVYGIDRLFGLGLDSVASFVVGPLASRYASQPAVYATYIWLIVASLFLMAFVLFQYFIVLKCAMGGMLVRRYQLAGGQAFPSPRG